MKIVCKGLEEEGGGQERLDGRGGHGLDVAVGG